MGFPRAFLIQCILAVQALSVAQADSGDRDISDTVYRPSLISLDTALDIAIKANTACREEGFQPTTTVIDSMGQIKVQLHSDHAFPHTIQTSYRKALTAASRRTATSQIVDNNEHESDLVHTFNAIGLTTMGGGVPIYQKGVIIGGIGIAGAPGENENNKGFDEICAEQAIRSIKSLSTTE
ncbi:MAG: heme-binding protein [Pseudomonadota bacterium]